MPLLWSSAGSLGLCEIHHNSTFHVHTLRSGLTNPLCISPQNQQGAHAHSTVLLAYRCCSLWQGWLTSGDTNFNLARLALFSFSTSWEGALPWRPARAVPQVHGCTKPSRACRGCARRAGLVPGELYAFTRCVCTTPSTAPHAAQVAGGASVHLTLDGQPEHIRNLRHFQGSSSLLPFSVYTL